MVSLSPLCFSTFSVIWQRFSCLYSFSSSFNFIQWSFSTAKSSRLKVLFFILISIRYGPLAWIGWYVSVSESQRIFCVSLPRTDYSLCIYHLFVWRHLSFLHKNHLLRSPSTLSCTWSFIPFLLVYCIRLLCVTDSSHSLHSPSLPFSCELIMFALTKRSYGIILYYYG